MSWSVAGQFAVWVGALFVAVLIVLFCAAAIMTLYEDYIVRKLRAGWHCETMLAEERALRKQQNSDLRKRMRQLENTVQQLSTPCAAE